MPPEQADLDPGLPRAASQAAAAILDDCRAARIADITDFAQCLVTPRRACKHHLTFNSFRYCVHPQRETIIARTLAAESPPGG